MPFIDSNKIEIKQPLPGWDGRFFDSATMTFGYYNVVASTHIHTQMKRCGMSSRRRAIVVDHPRRDSIGGVIVG